MRIVVASVVLLGLGGSGLVCQRVFARGRYAVPYSTYGAGPEGAKALYLYSEEAGLMSRRWVQDLEGLPPHAMVVAIGGCDQAPNRRLSRYEIAELDRFVDAGGVLLVAGAYDYLWADAGVTLKPPPGCSVTASLAAQLARAERGDDAGDESDEDGAASHEPTPAEMVSAILDEPPEEPPVMVQGEGLLSGLGPLPLERPGTIAVTDAEGGGVDPILVSEKDAEPAAVLVHRGEGAIVVLASASLFQNRALSAADGGVVFARLARALAPQGPLLFDEYHLGVGERRSLGRYVRDIGGGPFVLQLLIVVALALLALGVRFGRPIEKRAPVPGGTASYVEGVGDLYARTDDARAALSLVAVQGISEIAAHHHLTQLSPERLVATLAERGDDEAAGAVSRLLELTALSELKGRKLVEGIGEVDDLVTLAKGNRG